MTNAARRLLTELNTVAVVESGLSENEIKKRLNQLGFDKGGKQCYFTR